jgi:hypothetical protein
VSIHTVRGSEKVEYVSISAIQVSRSPRLRIMMYKGLTVAMGGNMDTERINPSITALYLTLSLARAKAHTEPIIREKIVVKAATTALLPMILRNDRPVKMEM